MSSVNKPQDIQQWYNIILEKIEQLEHKTKQEKDNLNVQVVLRLREAILKSFIIVGFPKVSSIYMHAYTVNKLNMYVDY